ncbi:MAG TPA: ATP-binding SpoIIE family protein phosphatase [Terriglobales bacterium]|nr:ATP-binding SpoIIE family protein phosphatase [Terriglobales bacterium]
MEMIISNASQFAVDVTEHAHAGHARRMAIRCAEDINLGESERGAVAIAVTEMATNILKHAGRGKVICEPVCTNGSQGLRLMAVDSGPGIRDVTAALRDGYSTAGTPGNGLGAVRRLATHFEMYTLPERGTCIVAEFWAHKKLPKAAPLQVGVVCLPIGGESVCGDGWNRTTHADRSYLMVVDGLGHGEFAAEAAREAERIFADARDSSPQAILRDCHDALKKTRGAAVAIAALDHSKGTLSFCGVGNISAVLTNGQGRRGLASHNGTVGHHFPRSQEFTYPWDEDSVLIMHSDGVSSRWDLDKYPGIMSRNPSVMAALLYRDFARQRDDATVLVAKNRE